ncbi:ABC transporter ATP-binding protein [Halobacteriovorax sp. HLS]|uniref:ABC transporter ATP-binding protein n=1 Tax=Halobacteriovorax sp. HLS TaxID=2234000 RepID=UPI0013E3F5C8|nr:ATP-binding cassette domain-containing protein [Halobacteriovorax sp. HLS]
MQPSREKIISIHNFSFEYDVKFYKKNNDLRQLFVEIFTSPLKSFFDKNQKNYVLKDINLEVFSGDRVGILGVNGCGKTTLCRQLAGMGKKNDFVLTKDLKAILNTDVAAFPELTGRENIEVLVNLLYMDKSSEERKKIIEDAVSFSDIDNFIDTPFKNYSKGMKARVFLSSISSTPSKLLILDEVFDGADTFFSEKIAVRVKKMIAASGAVLFVSHDLEKIKEICNRVIVLKDGEIIYDGSTIAGIKSYLMNCRPDLSEI